MICYVKQFKGRCRAFSQPGIIRNISHVAEIYWLSKKASQKTGALIGCHPLATFPFASAWDLQTTDIFLKVSLLFVFFVLGDVEWKQKPSVLAWKSV